ncbi:Maleamate amidohydrolase [bacterium HR10]|nr:Maleamate amidohydrolase [bacterium HR10]
MSWEHEAARYRERGLGGRMGVGRKPALLVIDFSRGFTDPASPLGSDMSAAVQATNRLLDVAHARGLAVIFTTVAYEDPEREAGLWIRKIPALEVLRVGSGYVELDERLHRAAGDVVLVKKYASAFFGTGLEVLLRERGVDTLLIAGCTTSGCVRATVVDAVQYGFRPIVVREAVGDRSELAHRANLFDIEGKYGDVLPLEEVLAYLETIAREQSPM